ncbi:hypothetical protein G4Y73_13500 [Wenzhouxiangella sp. XN201]|uniref:hypothetical protein n=1 Tax=Wenzhouxiangella sp. XN201 TaxID=2710755 RepID=UPI0013CB708D|nr:hypothetical protein [Wenzhouxiangella sp. XN201]NEZ05166.1 hypothetical protein [Wenzhouxiangella sp. XN201]
MNGSTVIQMSLPTLMLLVCIAAPIQAGETETFSIDWYSIDGGGAVQSTGGDFDLSGTIGQADATAARVLQGGQWKLTGGFWALSLEDLADRLFGDRFEAEQGD